LSWSKLVQRQLYPRVEVSDDEVSDAVAQLQAATGKTEYFVNEIFLPVDAPEQEGAVHGFADKLLVQIKKTGAFGAIARQFSQGAGASNGGEIGWARQGMLAAEIEAALANSKSGDLLGPIKTSKGYHILAVRDQRVITPGGDAGTLVKLAQIARPFTPETAQKIVAESKAAQEKLASCAELNTLFPAAQGWQVQLLPERPIAALPPGLAPLARNLKVGTASPPEPQPGGLAFMAVCERTMNSTIDRNAIMRDIGGERLENLARGLLRDLKRNAYIDMRLGGL
jgi:peptidyl-prolyl cis-trans isomerase SurA